MPSRISIIIIIVKFSHLENELALSISRGSFFSSSQISVTAAETQVSYIPTILVEPIFFKRCCM